VWRKLSLRRFRRHACGEIADLIEMTATQDDLWAEWARRLHLLEEAADFLRAVQHLAETDVMRMTAKAAYDKGLLEFMSAAKRL
jgi:hypothetical protein